MGAGGLLGAFPWFKVTCKQGTAQPARNHPSLLPPPPPPSPDLRGCLQWIHTDGADNPLHATAMLRSWALSTMPPTSGGMGSVGWALLGARWGCDERCSVSVHPGGQCSAPGDGEGLSSAGPQGRCSLPCSSLAAGPRVLGVIVYLAKRGWDLAANKVGWAMGFWRAPPPCSLGDLSPLCHPVAFRRPLSGLKR